jgi:hypothetical protein
MPRVSAAARAMMPFRQGIDHRQAPDHLSTAGTRIWNEVILDRPDGYFRPEAFELLATFAEVSAHLERLWRKERRNRNNVAEYDYVLMQICRLATLQARLASELRLTPKLNIDRRSAQRAAPGNRPDNPLLMGKKAQLDS